MPVYYAGSVLINIANSLTFAIYTIFLYKNGLNLFQISLINVIYMVTIVLLEVPTGALADSIGRKRAVLISSAIAVAGFATYAVSRTIIGFAAAEILIGVASTLAYGAFEAWLINISSKQGFTGKVDFVFSQANIYAKIAGIVGGIVGAYLATVMIVLPFYIGAVLCFAQFMFFLMFMVDDNEKTKKLNFSTAFGQVKKITFEATKYCLGHRALIWVIVGGVIFSFVTQPLNMYWAPRFNQMVGDKLWMMGWLWALLSAGSLLGAFWTQRLLKKGKSYAYIMILGAIIFSSMVAISASSAIAWLAISSFVLHEFSRGSSSPVQLAYVNKFASEDKRATILSFESMISTVGSALGLLFFGYLAQRATIETSWLISALFVLLIIPAYLKAQEAERNA